MERVQSERAISQQVKYSHDILMVKDPQKYLCPIRQEMTLAQFSRSHGSSLEFEDQSLLAAHCDTD